MPDIIDGDGGDAVVCESSTPLQFLLSLTWLEVTMSLFTEFHTSKLNERSCPMIAKKHTLFITLAVCALALPTLGIAQQAVDRPVHVDGHFALTVSLSTGTISAGRDWGEATHLGRYENLLDSGGHLVFQPFTITATGTVTAANGDKLFWTTPGTSFEVEFTGGTGRFENAAGGFNTVSHSQPAFTVIDEDTVIVSFTYKGVGTITY